jgi:iron complex transport system permease protein
MATVFDRLRPLPRVAGRQRTAPVLAALVALLLATGILAAGTGAFVIPAADVLAILAAKVGLTPLSADDVQAAAVLTQIRLPRVLFAMLGGAALAVGGAVLQGLFRNPLADPALVGISGGAALAAAWTIVLNARLLPGLAALLGPFTLPLAAFAGALLATWLVHRLASVQGATSVAVMLLAGIAISALTGAGVGLAAYVASDEQLRNITFWQLGTLSGATWRTLGALAVLAGSATLLGLTLARPLDALALGEAEARHLGVHVERLKRTGMIATALAVGTVTAFCGIIGFVALVAPHILRLACGPSHRLLLPACALAGAILLTIADVVARTAVAPAELPIGVLTAFIGAPFFLVLLLRQRRMWAA